MDDRIYDAIVIGAGGMGSAAAYHLARSGARTLVLEQFSHGHTFGSSHGETRVIRMHYDKAIYTALMGSAYAGWRDLEAVSGKRLLYTTGGLLLAPEGDPFVVGRRAILDAAGVESEWLSKRQLAERFPQFRIEAGMSVLWQKDTGFLHAEACVSTHLQLAETHGAEVREETRVTGIDRKGEGVEVVAEGERFRGRKAIVTAGPWTGEVLRELNLPLTVTRQQVVYYRPTDVRLFLPDRFPVFGEAFRGETFYGLPVFGREGVKVARDGMGQEVSPDTCDRTPDEDYVEHVRDYLRGRLPDAAGEALHSHICLYTETPDHDFIVDTHPECPQVILAAGFSGHGFKFCGLMGSILSEMALEDGTDFDIDPFRLARFG